MRQAEIVSKHFANQAESYRKATTNPVWSYLKNNETKSFIKLLGKKSYPSALDIGCGQGHYSWVMAKGGAEHLIAIDLAPGMGDLNFLPPQTIFERSSIESFNSQEKFDLISMMGCWEFLEKPIDNLSKVLSWLKPGGEIILSCPKDNLIGDIYRCLYATKGIALNRLGLKELVMWCEEQGLKISIQKGSLLCWVMKVSA